MCNIESAVNTFQRIRHVRDQLVGSHIAFCLSVDGGVGGGLAYKAQNLKVLLM